MNVETTLTDELRAVAASVQPPPAPIAELVHAAERARTRTRVWLAAITLLSAAAVIAAVVAGNGMGSPDTAPPPTHPPRTATDGPLPTGAPPRAPYYVVQGRLYVGGTRQPGRWFGVASVEDSAAATLDHDGEAGGVVLFRDGVEVARLRDVRDVVFSPSGNKVAWMAFAPDMSSVTLIERDMRTGRELGRLALDPKLFDEKRNEEAWETLMGVADDGRVTYGGVVVAHTWNPGSTPIDSTPDPEALTVAGFPDNAVSVEVGPDGKWGAWLTGRAGQPRPDDANDTWRLDGVTVQRPDEPQTRFTIKLPIGTDARMLTWETTTDLLVTVFDDQNGDATHFLRCSITDRHCEEAPTP